MTELPFCPTVSALHVRPPSFDQRTQVSASSLGSQSSFQSNLRLPTLSRRAVSLPSTGGFFGAFRSHSTSPA